MNERAPFPGRDNGQTPSRVPFRPGPGVVPVTPHASALRPTQPSAVRPAAAPGTSPARPIRVLVVDDSVLMRQAVRRILNSDDGIEVVDIARDGLEALAKIEKLQPDVLTMDVEMPHMDGLSALRLLMERFPCPVVMLSSLTSAGAEATVKALSMGAIDFMQKPSGQSPGGLGAVADQLIAKVRHAATARVRKPLSLPASRPAPSAPVKLAGPVAPTTSMPPGPGREPDRLLVIGSSTGGPRALAEVVSALPGDLPCAVLIVQHLPAGFTKSLADRLDQSSALSVAEAKDGDFLAVGRVLVAPGDFHLKVVSRRVQLEMGPRRHGVRPSVDTTLETAAAVFGPGMLTAILTGMGEDGRDGAGVLKEAGGIVLAEHESTCVVYGMPRAVVEAGLADEVVPLDRMAATIARYAQILRPYHGASRLHRLSTAPYSQEIR
jgi:two-component system chemotaxis response regulator CheB